MTKPRDPLQNETLRVPESERIESSVPSAYRLVYRPNAKREVNKFGLQGAFRMYTDQGMLMFEWRNLPTHIED